MVFVEFFSLVCATKANSMVVCLKAGELLLLFRMESTAGVQGNSRTFFFPAGQNDVIKRPLMTKRVKETDRRTMRMMTPTVEER